MSVLSCPRCRRANPQVAVYCYFDGADLRGRVDGQALHRLAQEFVFPSGRRCRTFDELAQGCRDEWSAARDLLRQGVFRQFFGSSGRADLARAAQEAMTQADGDIGLTTFLGALPVLQTQAPKLDINPRRFLLGNLLAGEQRTLQLIISNQGQGILQGTLTVVEGSDWLKMEGANANQLAITTPREQKIVLKVDTRGQPAGQTYGAKLTVITNGGVVEVLARMDLVAQPFSKSPFQGVKTPREMAERMRAQPKAAGPILESGDVSRWFAANGWNFPIRGPQARGVAGVQQFFETMGLSKPPIVRLSQSELRLTCKYPEPLRMQVLLQTQSRKWVYGHITSEAPWLKVLTPQVSGPQQASLGFEIDPTAMTGGSSHESTVQVVANSGQILSLRVLVEVVGLPTTMRRTRSAEGAAALPASLFRPILAMALAFLLLRFVLVIFVDTGMRSAAVSESAQRLVRFDKLKLKGDVLPGMLGELKQKSKSQAAAQGTFQDLLKDLDLEVPLGAPLDRIGGWLRLPWPRILVGTPGAMEAKLLCEAAEGEVSLADFQDHFLRCFLRSFVLFTWWIGALFGAVTVWRRGGTTIDILWGMGAGAVAGLAASATLGCAFLVGEIVPHTLWSVFIGAQRGSAIAWFIWVIFALLSWAALGAVVGLAFGRIAPFERVIVRPVENLMGRLFRLFGLGHLWAN